MPPPSPAGTLDYRAQRESCSFEGPSGNAQPFSSTNMDATTMKYEKGSAAKIALCSIRRRTATRGLTQKATTAIQIIPPQGDER